MTVIRGVVGVSEVEMLEPAWQQEVRELLTAYKGVHIDAAGYIHGGLCTKAIRDVLRLGGGLIVHPTGTVRMSNWQ